MADAVSGRGASLACALPAAFAAIGLGAHAAMLEPPIAVGLAERAAIFGGATVALWFGVLCALGETDRSFPGPATTAIGRLRLSWTLGARRFGPAAWLLACLPLATADTRLAPLAGMLAAASLVLLCIAEAQRMGGPVRSVSALPSLPAPAQFRIGGWEIGSLVFCACATAWFVVVARGIDGNNDNDAAYYFAVARHMVRTGRFEEPMVWHYLTRPASAVHPPFDYWQGLTSLLLLPSMALFGASARVAMVTMALIAGASLILLWYLVAVAAPLRSRVAQAVALVAFAASPALGVLRFDTESVPVFHLVLIAALVAFAHGRLVLAAASSFLLYLTRGDGAVMCLLLWGACGLAAFHRQRALRGAAMRALICTIALVLVAHIGLCLALYGAPAPPGARAVLALGSYSDLYRFGGTLPAIDWSARLSPARVLERFWVAWDNLRTIAFLPQQALWIGLVLLAGWRSPSWRLTRLVWLLLFVGGGGVALASGVAFASWRALYTTLPLVVLAAAIAVDHLLESVSRWPQRFGTPRLASVVVSAGVLALLAVPLSRLRPYAARPHALAAVEAELRGLSPRLGEAVVASMHPWTVAATTDSRAVMIPVDAADGIEAAFRRYGVSWLVLSDVPCMGEAADLCAAIMKGKRSAIGGLQLRRVQHGGRLALFHVASGPVPEDGGS